MTNEHKSNILLIDNDTAFCQQFDFAFKNKYAITFINDRKNVVSALIKNTFDLILLDLYLTHEKTKNGFELIQVIRNNDAEVPIVVITKDDQKKTSIEAHSKYNIKAVILKQKGSFEDWAITIDSIIT